MSSEVWHRQLTRHSYNTTSTSALSGRRSASKEVTFFEKSWTFRDPGKGRTENLPSDNYTWPFELILDGTLPESVEGMKDAYVVYRFKAEIGRKRAKDVVVRKPLRIVRTLGPSALELSHAMSIENIWPNKVEYSISTPSKAVVFGSFLQLDFRLVPLLKGLKIGNITTQLKEEQEFVLDPEWGITALNGGRIKDERLVVYDIHIPDPESDLQILEEAAEGFQFSRYLELPKTLSKCMQDCSVKGIKIRHKVTFNVQLLNPDGHVSELRANLPVSLYISESLPLNENNDLVDQTPRAGRAAVENDILHSAPPVYGEHQFDQLYSDVDPSGYRTPGAALSGTGTPYTQSRNISSENLASLDAITAGPMSVSPNALQHRLQDLRLNDQIYSTTARENHEIVVTASSSRRNSQTYVNGDYTIPQSRPELRNREGSYEHDSGFNSAPDSNDISRRTSNEDQVHTSGTATPFLRTDHFEDLSKVPSYSTAVRTPVPRSGGVGAELPAYGACVGESLPAIPKPPASAHLRESHALSYPPLGTQHMRPSVPNQHSGHPQDEERRLRLIQQRARS